MPIRVLHIIGSLRLGGAQVVVKQIVENASDEFEHFVYPLRAKQIDIPIEGTVIRNAYPNYDPRKFFDILKVCKNHKIDVIHAHLHKPILGALLTTYFSDIPVIVHEHGSIARPGIQYAIYRRLLRLLKKKAGKFIAVSKAAAKQLTQYARIDPSAIEVVYNAVDRQKFSPNPETRQSIRKELELAPNDIAVGFVGRLSYVKGPDILLEAFRQLLDQKTNCTLIYLGEGDMRNSLRMKAEELGINNRVQFLGFRENVSEIMNAFDIAAITSRQDAFPLTPLEIMSMRIPLVSCTVYGLAEVVSNEQNALVPPKNTPTEICSCLERLIDDNTLRQALTDNAEKTACQFDIPRLITKLDAIYHLVTKKD